MPKDAAGRPYATEEELLAFANKVRRAGGANIIEALMPSDPFETEACLIANALNFGCSVTPDENYWYLDGSKRWVMLVGGDTNGDKVRSLARELRMRVVKYEDIRYFNGEKHVTQKLGLLLPKRIGNAAEAFDNQQGWTVKYNKEITGDE